MLLWVKSHASNGLQLTRALLREVCSYLSCLPCLVSVSASSLSYFNFSLQVLEPAIALSRPLVHCGSAWTVINHFQLIFCGGFCGSQYERGTSLKAAYEVHRSGRVRQLRDMKFARDSCGLVLWRKAVYAFGSLNGEGRSKYERLLLEDCQDWKLLGSMADPRANFRPVVWLQAIYLCGGFFTDSIEVFDGRTLRLLPCHLPEVDDTAVCVKGNSLLSHACSSRPSRLEISDHLRERKVPTGSSIWVGCTSLYLSHEP